MSAEAELAGPGMQEQVQRDKATLEVVVAGLKDLERRWSEARLSVAARERGYFIPEEDDKVRQLVLAYRNYRFALYEIIFRAYQYRTEQDANLRIGLFLVGLGAGLVLYSKSLRMIEAYEHEPLVRTKLNEPDMKFEINEGFFEEVLRAYSSPGNYRDIIAGLWFWRQQRREIRGFVRQNPDWAWLAELILMERRVVSRRLAHVLLCRLRHDWRAFVRTVLQPVRTTRYNVTALIGNAGARVRTTGHYRPAIKPSHVAQINALLRPGDIVLVRAEKKLTSAILPGFWAHAVLYAGSPEQLESIRSHPYVARHWQRVVAKSKQNGCVIEGISPEVQVESLARALFVDHVLVVRPVLEEQEIRNALVEAFGHVGKPYDFEFDFNVTSRLVCTELIYRCYHGRGKIVFPLIKRLGRFTLSGDDIGSQLVSMHESRTGDYPLELISLAISSREGRVQFLAGAEILPILKRIQSGWKPADGPPAQIASSAV